VLNLCPPLSRRWRTMMDSDGTRFAAIVETTSFLNHFKALPGNRQAGKVDYPLPEVLLLILLAALAGAEAFTDIARFGERKIELLRRPTIVHLRSSPLFWNPSP
jgi:hypothetical protein